MGWEWKLVQWPGSAPHEASPPLSAAAASFLIRQRPLPRQRERPPDRTQHVESSKGYH